MSDDTTNPFAKALALHQQGQLRDAEAGYERILEKDPGNIAVRFHHGLVRLQLGDIEGGIRLLQKLLELSPLHGEAMYNLGLAWLELGNADRALGYFKRLSTLFPELPEAWFYLGMTLSRLGRHEEALPHFIRTVSHKPGLAEAHHNLGSALAELGRHEEAAECFIQALKLKPQLAEACNGLGSALFHLNRLVEAGNQFRRAIQLNPDLAEAHTGLSDVLRSLGDYDAAEKSAAQALRLAPTDPVAQVVHGQALSEQGRHAAALSAFEKGVELQPDNAAANHALGAALSLWSRYAEARMHLDKAIRLDPGNVHSSSVRLFQCHYNPDLSAVELAVLHREFAESFETPLVPSWQPHANLPDPGRDLKVGFVSADFKSHPVGHFMADLLASLKDSGLELYAYVNQWSQDSLTDRIRSRFSVWRECQAMSDEELVALIRRDGIDILFDLSGHTKGNRLLVFARKPAPVQVSYLGYFDTTGLAAVDYILGNRWLLPESEDGLYSEKPWRLPDAHLCFSPPELPVQPGPLPSEKSGRLTFGCFNQSQKVNPKVISCWARILHAMPDSCLFLKSEPYGDPAVASHFKALFAERGINPERLILEGKSPYGEYLESYQRVDIALDPYPYNGGTTTIQAMWMGVPTLTLKGDRYAAHMGESILYAVGMQDWIATSEDDYFAKAIAFGQDRLRLATLRSGLRHQLLNSPICNASSFAKNLESALRGMWEIWCEHQHEKS